MERTIILQYTFVRAERALLLSYVHGITRTDSVQVTAPGYKEEVDTCCVQQQAKPQRLVKMLRRELDDHTVWHPTSQPP